jgi:hypothetical protein
MLAVPGRVKTSGMEPEMNWKGWLSKPAAKMAEIQVAHKNDGKLLQVVTLP